MQKSKMFNYNFSLFIHSWSILEAFHLCLHSSFTLPEAAVMKCIIVSISYLSIIFSKRVNVFNASRLMLYPSQKLIFPYISYLAASGRGYYKPYLVVPIKHATDPDKNKYFSSLHSIKNSFWLKEQQTAKYLGLGLTRVPTL